MGREVDYDSNAKIVSDMIGKIHTAFEKDIDFRLIPEIKKIDLKIFDREKIVKAIRDRLKKLTGILMPVSTIRKKLLDDLKVEIKQPKWCKQWIYVNSHSGYVNLSTLALHKSESFNVENGKFIPTGESGNKLSASRFVSDNGFMKKVDSIAYLPGVDEVICNIDGNSILNSFNPRTIPQEASEFTKSGLKAIELVKKHIKFVCSNDQDSKILLQWLAHQIQYPGKKILWSPIIQSVQGAGKSFFGELLRICLGDSNVGTVSSSQVVGNFNGWATNVIVNILEELKISGHNRHDAVNALKPLITDRMIQINQKGIAQYSTYNTTNYMCFTNYKDALPVGGDDRRWWVIFIDLPSLDDLKSKVGESAEVYFPKLFNAIRKNSDQIRKFFLEYSISDEFFNTNQAPMTDHKLTMIATEESSFEGFSELKDLINEGGKYFNKKCLCSVDLFGALKFVDFDIEINSIKRHVLLKKLGYSLLPIPMKIDGKTRRVWTKSKMTKEEIRKTFDNFQEDL